MMSLYSGETRYAGDIFAESALVPAGEIWVFQQRDGDFAALWEMGEFNARRSSSWLPGSFTIVYKFHQQIDYPWSITLFQDAGIPIRIEMKMRLLLSDPLVYVESGQFQADHTQVLEYALYKVLCAPLHSGTGNKQAPSPALPTTFHDLVPPVCRRFTPDTQLSRYIRTIPEFSQLGLLPQISVLAVHKSPAYQQLLQRAETDLAEELRTVRQHVLAEAANLQDKRAVLDLYEHYYEAQIGFADLVFPQVRPALETQIRDAQGGGQYAVPPALVATIFNDLLCQEISLVVHGSTRTGEAHNTTATQQPRANQRDVQLQVLYENGQQAGWKLSPPQDAIIEQIIITLNDGSDMTLSVPRAYPHMNALMTVVHDSAGVRLPSRQINSIVAPIVQSGVYDLWDLVQAVANR